MATKIFLDPNDDIPVGFDADIVGSSGSETVSNLGAFNLEIDANVERLELPQAASAYEFTINGTQIVISLGGAPVATFASLNQTTTIAFADGSAPLVLSGLDTATLGGASLPTTAGAVSPSLDTSDTSDGAGSDGGTTTPPPSNNGGTFDLTDADIPGSLPDNLDGTAGPDLFDGGPGETDSSDDLDGLGDTDTLKSVLEGGDTPRPTLNNIEIVEVESIGEGENNFRFGDTSGVDDIKVLDNGDDTAPLALTELAQGAEAPVVHLKGDGLVSVGVQNSGGSDDTVDVTVEDFQGEFNLRNSIETVNMVAVAGSTSVFNFSDSDGDFETMNVSGEGETDITSSASTTYNYAGAADHSLTLTGDDPNDQVIVNFAAGDDMVDFTTTMDDQFEAGHPNIVDGGAGNDIVKATLNTPIDVIPTIEDVEAVWLTYGVDNFNNATFSAENVSDNPVYIIDESSSYVQLTNLADPAEIEIIGDLADGATFTTSGTSAVARFVTDSQEEADITVTGQFEFRGFDSVKVINEASPNFPNPPLGTGQGEVIFENQILLNDDATKFHIETTAEDDQNADNDGDILVNGTPINDAQPTGALVGTADLDELYVNATNGNIWLGDGSIADDDEAMRDASSLTTLTVMADNAIASLGDIGDDDAALNLRDVDLSAQNRGVLNLDDIDARDGFTTNDGAVIEKFNVKTAFRSETNTFFDVEGQPEEVGNDIDDLEAGFVRNMRLNVAEFGSLAFGEISSSLGEVDITGAGDLWMVGSNRDGSNAEPFFVNDLQADTHTGNIMLDFFAWDSTDDVFGAAKSDPTTIVLGDQDSFGRGVRFDSYDANIKFTSGAGDLTASNDTLPDFVADNGSPVIAIPGVSGSFYGLVLGNGDDTASTGGGSDYVLAGAGDDTIDAGDGTDIVEGGLGNDTISLGSQSPGDGDADIVVFGSDVMKGEGEKPDFSYDVVHDFEEGSSGDDIVHIVKPGDAFIGSTDMVEINSGEQLDNIAESSLREIDIFEFTTDFGTINLDLSTPGLDQDQVEDNFWSLLQSVEDVDGNESTEILDDYLDDQNEGVFALGYDNSNDPNNVNAGLFYLDHKSGVTELGIEDVRLVSVFTNVGANNMEANDFEIFG